MEDYLRLVHQDVHARLYDVVMMFNLKKSEQLERCEQCLLAEEMFFKTARSFKASRDKGREVNGRKVFFGYLTVSFDEEWIVHVFSTTYHYSTIPWLSVSLQQETLDPYETSIFHKDHETVLTADQTKLGVNWMITFINHILVTDVRYQMTTEEKLRMNGMVSGTVIAFMLLIVYGYPLLVKQWLWLIIACTIWVVSLSCMVWCK